MRRKKRISMLALLLVFICTFSLVVFASENESQKEVPQDEIEVPENKLAESTLEENETSEKGLPENGQQENETQDTVDSEIGDSYVYDGQIFVKDSTVGERAVTKGTIDYTYWAIHAGAGFGDILEDGRDLDHVGCIMLKVGGSWKTAYCVHHNADLKGGHEYADTASYLTDSNKKKLTGQALYYGFNFNGWNPDKKTVPSDADKGKYTATQVMVWLIERGWYTFDADTWAFKLDTKAVDIAKKICDKSDQSPAGNSYQYFKSIYDNMQKFGTIPSFTYRSEAAAQVKNMGYDFDKKQYVLKLTDTNNVLSLYDISETPQGVTVKKEGTSTLAIYSSSPINSAVKVKLSKTSFKPEKAVTVWSDQTTSGYQQIGTYQKPDTASMDAYLKITAQTVTMATEKVWNDKENVLGKRPKEILVDLYSGKSKGAKDALVKTVSLNADNKWQSSVTDLPYKYADGSHIYYAFFERDAAGYESSVEEHSAGTRHWKFTFTNTLNVGNLGLMKKSANETLTNANSCYSLQNAEYGVYSDKDCINRAGILTTDESGNSNILTDLKAGVYYVKEIKKPLGYQTDKTIHEVTVKAGETAVVSVEDEPIVSQIPLQIEKFSSDGKVSAGKFPLTGAEFTIDYYAEGNLTREDISERTPTKTWVILIKEVSSGQNKVYMTGLGEEYLVSDKSDGLYQDNTGASVLPLGTVTIRETKAAKGYLMQGYVDDENGQRLTEAPDEAVILHLSDGGESAEIQGETGINYHNMLFKAFNVLHKCSISIMKLSASVKPLENVVLALYDENGDRIMSAQTDENGKITFDELEPGDYWLKEEKTVNGQQLLKEPVKITLPMILTEKEVEEQKIDKNSLVYDEEEDVYRLYDRTFEITNSGNLVLPMTGGQGQTFMLAFFLAACGFMMTGIYLKYNHKKKNS